MSRLLLAALLSIPLLAQTDRRHSLTFSAGYLTVMGPAYPSANSTYLLGGSYGYRLRPHLQLDLGVHVASGVTSEIRGASYDFTPDDRFVWAPFGLRGVLPLVRGRLELSAGGGGLYERYTGFDGPTGAFAARNGWGGYATAGFQAAVDPARRFWIGASPQWFLTNAHGAYDRSRWFAISADLSFRF